MINKLLLSVVLITAVWFFFKYDVETLIIPPTAILPDGSRYFGEINEGKFIGEGKIIWENGDSYHGNFKDGLFSGLGQLQKASGDSYQGQFIAGDFTGQGTLSTLTGNVYKGEFKSYNFDGFGSWEFNQGSSYVGYFKEGMFQGSGTMINKDVETYTGQFENNQYHGQGSIKYNNGDSYQGHFYQGKFHGQGLYKNSSGERFEGEFVKSNFTGQGIYEDSYQNRYEGGFKDWYFDGKGKWSSTAGQEYQGEFSRGTLSSVGSFKDKDGLIYNGEFKDWKFHGIGELFKANGDHYKGEFKYGKSHGLGVLTYATPKDGVTKLKGLWRKGKYKGVGKQNYLPKTNTEKALYNQNTLIQKTLSNLLASDKDKINMYFLGIGGDGKQDVFYKEVTTIRRLFDQSFATVNRSAVLINNAQTVDSIALATNTSIEQVMLGMSKIMDENKDVLFIYLSSHGSKNHEFVLDQEGLSLTNLSKEQLAILIKKLPVKRKVIVISACYAGGFLTELKGDDNLMVITAAADDRKSFGCSDDADMTYFGRAFFTEALLESDSFETAFEKAKEIIKQREKKHIKNKDAEHSNPQIYSPKLISEYLKRWWSQFEQLRDVSK